MAMSDLHASATVSEAPVRSAGGAQARPDALGVTQLNLSDSLLKHRVYFPIASSMLARGPAAKPINRSLMTNDEILVAVAKIYGIDPKEADLGLRYAAASRELAQRTLTATPDEAKRLKGMKRLASLTLDLYQRLKVAVLLPSRLTDERQADIGGQLEGTSQELRRLEKTLFGASRTPHDNLVSKANVRRKVWAAEKRANPVPESE